MMTRDSLYIMESRRRYKTYPLADTVKSTKPQKKLEKPKNKLLNF